MLLVGMLWTPSASHPPASADPVSEVYRLELQPGDLVFRRGVSARSQVILATQGMRAGGGAQEETYTHVGVIVLEGRKILVAHAAPAEAAGEPGVSKVEPLAVFLQASRAGGAAVYRLDSTQVAQAAQQARRAAGVSRRLAEQALAFDYHFDLTTPQTLYCTELVLRAYGEVGVDLQVRASGHFPLLPQPVVYPADVMRSPLLRRVRVEKVRHPP